MLMNRRTFLSHLSQAAAVAALPGSVRAWGSLPAPIDIGVLGGGIAGLCAAYELEKLGHRVTILEAQPDRLGGRVRTHRFSGGDYGELGAMRIPASHALTRRYVAELGLELRPFVNFNARAYAYYDGARSRIGELSPERQREIAPPLQGGIFGQDFDEIVGGMDRLAQAFGARLKTAPRMGCAVTSLSQPRRGRVSVEFCQAGASGRVEFDRVICTLPFPVLRNTPRLLASFSRWKQLSIRKVRYGRACKALALTRCRFWESDDGITGGATYTDLATGETYYPSAPQAAPGRGVLLASYARAGAAERFEEWPASERAGDVLENLSRVHPQLGEAGMAEDVQVWCWDENPWSQGAFALEGQDNAVHFAQLADGRVHFAGEHTSLTPAWIQGALESALRVVGEISSTAATGARA
jgi:monoamine oxidase